MKNGQVINSFLREQYKSLLLLFSLFLFFSVTPAVSQEADLTPHYATVNFGVDTIDGLVANEREIRAGLLYDVVRDKIIWEKDMDYAYPIASLTKMMVGLLAMEDIAAGTVCLDDRITVTRT